MNTRLRLCAVVLFLVCCCGCIAAEFEQTKFVVIIPSYKNIRWFKKNLDSLMMQENTYTNWRAMYVDDCSPDGTGQAVKAYIAECGFEHKITVIQNQKRIGAMANLYNSVWSCDDHEVCCILDGDDWLLRDDLFLILNNVYSDPHVWLTYGQYHQSEGGIGQCMAMPNWVIEQNAFRDVTWVTSHMRTFYAGLFKKIKQEDLMWNGDFFPVSCDFASMFPMLEMAGTHIRFNPIIVYEYNMDNPINDYKKDLQLIFRVEYYIRHMQRYLPLARLFE